MALEISYWTGRGKHATQVYGSFISAETRSLSGSTAQSGAIPAGATVARIEATEDARVQIGGTNPTADASSLYMSASSIADFEVKPGDKIAGKTA